MGKGLSQLSIEGQSAQDIRGLAGGIRPDLCERIIVVQRFDLCHAIPVIKHHVIVPLFAAFWYPSRRIATYPSERTNGSFKFVFNDPRGRLPAGQLGAAHDYILARRVYLGDGYPAVTPHQLWLRPVSLRTGGLFGRFCGTRLVTDRVRVVNS